MRCAPCSMTDNSPDERYRINKALMRRAFDRAAHTYEDHAPLQKEVAQRMAQRLDLVKINPRRVLDIGSATGRSTRMLAQCYPRAQIIALDISLGMLRMARRATPLMDKRFTRRTTFTCAEAEALPFVTGSVDLVFSNLTLQWCDEPERALSEMRRVLAPGGLLMFSSFGPDTLKELRESFARADGFVHVHAFMDMHDIGDALLRVRFSNPVMDVEQFTLTYPDVDKLMRDLKALGAHNVSAGRAHGLTGKTRMRNMRAAYEAQRRNGVLPATYEVVYGHAWAPEVEAQKTHDGTVKIPLSSLRGRKNP